MPRDFSDETSPTLLGRLAAGPSDDAWNEFVEQYAPAVHAWAWQSGLQESDAADVTQEVLMKLLEKMQTFRYDRSVGSFRGWLKTVTVNAAKDLGRRISRLPDGPAGLSSVGDPKSWDDLSRRIDEEYQRQLVRQAEQLVRTRVNEQQWMVYELLVQQECSASDVAKQLEMKLADVYVAKSRLLKRLRDVVTTLESIDAGAIR
ncbi:ECF RNA polymerase sigma factor SigE [Rubripirellula tenax]|uniref:ECF RNA polymerase sigma factor SigE n=1 Tax=Rubripirellula tenax TaxID=2528015 RepID=A0A5C6FBJ5_9BACT|nr:sigma-70 family RNA polymerase sigma factor [Rubripirellula tenax]TWU56969.1 ECF RNA polymerase sigma factor SigE [Rubripirellula tenax]